VLAVEATPAELNPELVLFTVRELDREEVNGRIRAAGLSALHNIRAVRKVEQIPVLGTGKTDYRALKEMLKT
jgi:long-chain-fatty-acid--[acyl-carrier-protein] ligase